MCQCRFTNYNKCTTLVVVVDNRRGYGCVEAKRTKEKRKGEGERENEREMDGEIEEGRKELPVMSLRFWCNRSEVRQECFHF